MSEIVNLRLARKRKDRAEQATTAAANRARHGRTRSEREGQQAESQRAERVLDGAQRAGALITGRD